MLYRRLLVPALWRAAAVMLFACASSAAALAQGTAGPLRVGFICPTTGGSSDFGNSARLGAELAVKEINEVGGFLGRKIELVQRDDQANPERGRQMAEDLVLKELLYRRIMEFFVRRLESRARDAVR